MASPVGCEVKIGHDIAIEHRNWRDWAPQRLPKASGAPTRPQALGLSQETDLRRRLDAVTPTSHRGHYLLGTVGGVDRDYADTRPVQDIERVGDQRAIEEG